MTIFGSRPMISRLSVIVGWALIVVFGGLIAVMFGGWSLQWVVGEYPSHDEEWMALTFIAIGSAVAGIPAAVGVWLVRRERARQRGAVRGRSDVASVDIGGLVGVVSFSAALIVLLWATELVVQAAVAAAFVTALVGVTTTRLARRSVSRSGGTSERRG